MISKNSITIILLCSLFFIFFSSTYKKIPISFWDEHAWIGRSYYFDLLIKGDFKNELWQTQLSYDQPKLGEYVYGMVLYPGYLQNKKNSHDYSYMHYLVDNNFYSIHSPALENYKEKNSAFIDWEGKNGGSTMADNLIKQFGTGMNKTIAIIYKARFINIIFLTVTIAIVFLITNKISNYVTAVITSILYGINNLIIISSLRAYSEGLFLLLYLSCIYFILVFFTGLWQRKNNFKILYILAILLPLLVQTKLNGIMLLFFVYLFLAVFIIFSILNKNKKLLNDTVQSFLIITGIFLLIFISLHPFLYKNPIKNTFFLFSNRITIANLQAENNLQDRIVNNPSRINKIYTNFLFGQSEQCQYSGIYSTNETCGSYFYYLRILLFFTGFIIFCIRTFINKKILFILFLTLFLFVQFVMSFYLVLNWGRYYVPLSYFFLFFQSYGLVSFINYLKKSFHYFYSYKFI